MQNNTMNTESSKLYYCFTSVLRNDSLGKLPFRSVTHISSSTEGPLSWQPRGWGISVASVEPQDCVEVKQLSVAERHDYRQKRGSQTDKFLLCTSPVHRQTTSLLQASHVFSWSVWHWLVWICNTFYWLFYCCYTVPQNLSNSIRPVIHWSVKTLMLPGGFNVVVDGGLAREKCNAGHDWQVQFNT